MTKSANISLIFLLSFNSKGISLFLTYFTKKYPDGLDEAINQKLCSTEAIDTEVKGFISTVLFPANDGGTISLLLALAYTVVAYSYLE